MPIFDRFHSTVVTRARLLALAPATCLLLSLPVAAQQPSALAQAELQRRAAKASEGRELLKKGDEAYEAGRWADAVAAYSGARELLPAAPATAALREAATQRLVQASIEQARHQRRLGDVAGAGETVGRVLEESVAPGDPLATGMLEQINDPIRTNPAATLEHTGDVEEVRMLLYKAEGYFNLGEYDMAGRVYEEVLRVDPFNKASRRGMERVAQYRADYARAAYDQTRATMLGEVDGGWELRVRPTEGVPEELTPTGGGGSGRMLMTNKLERIILPVVDFDAVNIREALDFLRQQSIERDTFELDPAERGINFVLEIGAPDSEIGKQILATQINLQLKNVPLSQVLKYINEVTRTVHVAQEFAVTLRPAGADSTEMITRSYAVPPDFLTSGGAGGGAEAADDPFADDGDDAEGLIPRRLSAQEVLKQQGVSFPEGASASYNAGGSTLQVRNTAANHAMIEEIVAAITATEPAMVLVEVRMIKTQERVLKELGFDWLLGEFSLGGSGLTPGTPGGVLSGGALNPQDFSDFALSPGDYFQRALTAGNRSGDGAIIGDSIDDLLLEQSQGFSRGASRAPGILWANGKLNNTDLTMLMRGLDRKKGVDLMASPSTATRSGQQSTVEIIRELIYPTEYEPPELPNTISTPVLIDFDAGTVQQGNPPLVPITPATPTSFETRGVGVVLDVLPTVSADRNYIDIALKPSVTDFDGFINYGTPITSAAPGAIGAFGFGTPDPVEVTPNEILMPVFSYMGTETNLTVADGATVVIGGMLQERLQKVEDKTKILGDLPVVGRLFQSQAYAPVRTAVVFLVTVKVVDPTGKPFRDR